jgi:hypothetical protein
MVFIKLTFWGPYIRWGSPSWDSWRSLRSFPNPRSWDTLQYRNVGSNYTMEITRQYKTNIPAGLSLDPEHTHGDWTLLTTWRNPGQHPVYFRKSIWNFLQDLIWRERLQAMRASRWLLTSTHPNNNPFIFFSTATCSVHGWSLISFHSNTG